MNAHLGFGSHGLCRKASRTHVSIKAVVSGIFHLSDSLKYISHSSSPCSFSETLKLKGYQMKRDVVEATTEGYISTKANG